MWTAGLPSNVGPENESSVTLLALAAAGGRGRRGARRLRRDLGRRRRAPRRLPRRPWLGAPALPRGRDAAHPEAEEQQRERGLQQQLQQWAERQDRQDREDAGADPE